MNENEQVQKPVEVSFGQEVGLQPKNNKKTILLVMFLLLAVVGLFVVVGIAFYVFNFTQKPVATFNSDTKQIVIGFSIGTLQEERWQKDKDEFIKQATEFGISVDIQGANNNKLKQISQAESMIAKGVDVLVIAPYDAESMVNVIDNAHKANIKVISYDRLMTKSNVDYYVSFDNEKVGQLEAQSVIDAIKEKLGKGKKLKIAYIGGSTTDNNALLLKKGTFSILQPLIDKGEIEIVVDKFSADWNPDIAYQNLKAYLDNASGAIDGVICANDGTAFGAVRALQEHNLAGKIPVSGQDAELAALRRIVSGTQTATVYKPIPKEVAAALTMAIKIANNERVDVSSKVNNGAKDVPSIFIEPVLVTKVNIENTVVKDNYHTNAEIYRK